MESSILKLVLREPKSLAPLVDGWDAEEGRWLSFDQKSEAKQLQCLQNILEIMKSEGQIDVDGYFVDGNLLALHDDVFNDDE